MDFPEYKGLQVRVPPFLELLKWLQENGFTKMQISTPGTVGVAALLAAKLLQIETSATYHTSFPEYVENYTRDISLEALTWKYMIALLPLGRRGRRAVAVHREAAARARAAQPQAVDPRSLGRHRALPAAEARPGFWTRLRDRRRRQDLKTKFVYVGRVGSRRTSTCWPAAFERIAAGASDDAHLVAWSGTARTAQELEQRLDGLPVTFTGFLEGDSWRSPMRPCDVKLFPSTTDTWGNAPLEAQAAGLPVDRLRQGRPAGADGSRRDRHPNRPGRDVDELLAAMEPS